jgi:hypothetical protein
MNCSEINTRARWLAEGSYGVMVHYLVSPEGKTPAEKTKALNRIIDGFDLDLFIRQFEASRADWLIFTVGQNTGYYNSPNSYLDRILPGRTPRRDLVLEIGQRLAALNKKYIAYLPAEVWIQSAEVQTAFAWNPADQTEFLKRYLEFLRAYSLQYGTLVHGWWFDGCYDEIHQGKWDWSEWLCAARAGNPEAIVAFNDGAFCVGREKPLTPLQDYHAGEVHLLEDGKIRFDFLDEKKAVVVGGKLRTPGREPQFYMPTGQFVDGVQWQALVPLDSTFNGAVPNEFCRYSVEEMIKFTRACKAVNGAVTFNAPIEVTGEIPAQTFAKIQQMGETLFRDRLHP